MIALIPKIILIGVLISFSAIGKASEIYTHYVVAEDIGNATNADKDCIKKAVAKHFSMSKATLDDFAHQQTNYEMAHNLDTLPDHNEQNKPKYQYLWTAAKNCNQRGSTQDK